ncbi:MAG: PD-(D/E)XK nuclease family protein, partial [Gammaproteobacteria bacterium]
MTQRLWHESEILAALEAGASVVTASDRLARAVRLAHADAARARGARVWERPEVLSWRGFLISLFTRHEDAQLTKAADTPRLLGASQTGALWETVVRAADDTGTLLQPTATAAAAQDAWKLCQDFSLSLKQIADYGSEDAHQFATWARAFSTHCETHGWLDEARLPRRLITWLVDGRLAAPENLLLAGFDEWTPLQMDLLAALAAAGSEIRKLEVEPGAPHSAQRVICADADDELRAAAQWAAALLERDPQTSIGIVVQDLAACRERFARTLDDALCAPTRVGQDIPRPWNMSLGRPLGDSPLVFDALQLLEIGKRMLTFDTASRLLRSSFLAGAETEYAARTRLELTLRKGGEHVSIKRWLELARHQGDVPILVRVLEAVRKLFEGLPVKQLPSDWARRFGELLRLVGWPGERQTNSREYQTLDAFRELLGELTRLDAVLGAITYADAAARLGQLAADKIFQPAAEDVPIQVLGLLEAAGLRFDHLWVLGLTDDRWPASPRPNPLLPIALQRRHSLPHASARRELQFAQQVTARLLASAGDVVVSTPARDADQDLRPSPLIVMLPQVKLAQLPQRESLAYARFLHAAAPTMEIFRDTRGPALKDMHVRGGTGILKSQAACPFQAFAR